MSEQSDSRYTIIAITPHIEKVVFKCPTAIEACGMSIAYNQNSCATTYVVETPNGERLTIKDQQDLLAGKSIICSICGDYVESRLVTTAELHYRACEDCQDNAARDPENTLEQTLEERQ